MQLDIVAVVSELTIVQDLADLSWKNNSDFRLMAGLQRYELRRLVRTGREDDLREDFVGRSLRYSDKDLTEP